MTRFGYKLMTETHDPRGLVRNACLAEDAGFDFVSISDHYLPWLDSHEHASFAWSVLGALAQATESIDITTGLTCPIIRYHPAIVAQAAATVAVLSEGRFTLALGAGENLNEHVVGAGWPAIPDRHAMLREAVEVIRLLWRGELCSHSGAFYNVESARIYDLPDEPIPIIIGAGGPKAARLAAEVGDGIMTVGAERRLLEAFEAAGGEGHRYAELGVGYAPSQEEGLALAHEYGRFGVLGWSVMAELPGVRNFEGAAKFVSKDDMRSKIPHGPDVETYVDAIAKFTDAGFDHIVLLPFGPEQEPFLRFFDAELAPRVRSMAKHPPRSEARGAPTRLH